MAFGITQKPNTDAPDATYPYGKTRDKTPSEGGTPFNTLVMGDFFQFFSKLMDESGSSFNGQPDNDTNGYQLYEALSAFTGGLRTKIIEIPNWNMDSTATKSIAHGLISIATVVSVDVLIRNDAVNLLSPIINGGAVNIDGTNIIMDRTPSGLFDSVDYDSVGGFNRGFITIKYT